MSQLVHNCGHFGIISDTSDFSGNVEVTADGGKTYVAIPAHMLITFVSEWLRMRRISDLEQQDTAQLLGVNQFDLPRECRVPK